MSVFEASVNVKLVESVSAGLASMSKQMTKGAAAAQLLQSRLDKISSTWKTGLLQIGGGMALGAPLVLATKEAMKLESAMARVKAQTGMSAQELKALDGVMTKTANLTGIFSKPKLAELAGDMSTSGLNKKQITEMMPLMAKAAEVNKYMSKGKELPEDTVHSLTALAHQFGKYSTKEMSPIAQASIAMSQKLPGGLKSLAATGASVNISGNRIMGVDPIELLAFQAAVAQTSGSKGGGGKGRLSASNMINALTRGGSPGSFGSGLLEGKQAFAARVMGLTDNYGASTVMKGNKLDLKAFQQKMASFQDMSTVDIAKRMRDNVMLLGKKAGDEIPLIYKALKTDGKGVSKAQLMNQLVQYQFGSSGSMALLMGEKKFLNQQDQMVKAGRNAQKNNLIETQMEIVSKTLDFQLNRLNTNFETLASTLGNQLLPRLTPIVEKMASIVDKVNAFAEKHPRIVAVTEALIGLAAGGMILGGAMNLVKAAFMGLKFAFSPLISLAKGFLKTAISVGFRVAPLLMRVVPWITRIASFVIGKMGPIGFAISALILIVTNWDSIVKATKPTWEALCSGFKNLGDALNRLLDVVISKIPFLRDAGKAWNNLNLGGSGMVPVAAGATTHAGLNNVAYAQSKRNIKATGLGRGNSTVVNSKPVINITMQSPPGHDHKKCQEQMIEKLANGLNLTSNGSSGSSVRRSIHHHGQVRR